MASAYFQQMLAIIAAGAGGVAPISVTTASQLEAAVAAAVSGTVISVDADITATTNPTLLVVPAGVAIEESAAYTVTGYYVRGYSGGNYTTTRFGKVPKRLTFVSPITNPALAYLGTFELAEGNFVVNANVKGLNGGGAKTGNLVNFMTRNNNRVEGYVYGDYENASADCVSGDTGTNPVAATSFVIASGAKFRAPGSSSSDNWFTGHNNVRMYAYNCDAATPSTAGPGINSAPVTSTMEWYGGTIDMTGSAGNTSSDLFLTRLVGAVISGTSTNNVRIVADGNKSKPALAVRNRSSIPIILAGTHAIQPVIADVEMTVADKYVGVLSVGPDYSGPAPLIAKIKGSLAGGSTSLVWLNKGGDVYNITSIHTSATNTVAVRANVAGTVGTPNTINVVRADINNTAPIAVSYATRSDQNYTDLTLLNSKVRATNAGLAGTTGSTVTATGTLLDGTDPAGGLTGWLNESAELAAVPRWQEVAAYLATCSAAPGVGTWPSNMDSFLT